MARITRKILIAFACAVVLTALATVLFLRDTSPALPNPNGYDDFVEAGQIVTTTLDGDRSLNDYRELSLQDLRAFAATNAEPLRIAQGALNRQCRVPIQNSADWFRTHLGEMSTFMSLARMFQLAARLAQLEGQTNDTLNLYLDLIRFAHESTRGGLIPETAVARVQEALGLEGLKAVEPALDAAQCRRIAKVLEELDARQESWDDYFRRDLRYALRAEIKSLFSVDSWRTHQSFKTKFLQAQLRRRQAMLTFAARACELETGSKPVKAAALVPAYLKAIPEDPVSGKRLDLPP